MIDKRQMRQPDVTVEQLWREHYEPLRRFCAVVIGGAEADDLATETFLACRDQLLFGDVVNPRAYLFRSAVNSSHNLRRSRDREHRRNTASVHVNESGSEGAELGHVREAIKSLSERQRAVLYLAYWEDQTETSIARTLSLQPGTVRRHLHRAHQQLRKALP